MSSILDAVTKDASRSGNIPGADSGGPLPPHPDGGGSGRYRTAAFVVVFGVVVGALAARLFGGGTPPADDMLTDKVASRAQDAANADAPARANRKDEEGHGKAAAKRKGASAPAREAGAPPAMVIPAPPAVAKAAPEPAAAPPPAIADAPAPAVVAEAPAPADATAPPVVVADAVPPPVAAPAPSAAPAVVAPPPAPPVVAAAAPAPAPVIVAPAPAPVVAAAAPAPVVVAPAPVPVAAVPPLPADMAVPPSPDPVVAEDGGAVAQPADASAEPVDDVLDEAPSGAPEVSIMFVAWSRAPSERLVSMRVGAGALSVVHEGEYVEGMQVSAIHPEAVDFEWTGQKFRVLIQPF